MPNGFPPKNLPTSQPKESSRPSTPPQEPKPTVPERPIFPQKTTEGLPQKPTRNRFGLPQDVIPKQSKELKEDSTPFMPEEGLSPEQVEKRETIKKVIAFLVVVLLVIFVGVFVFYRLKSSKPAEIKSTPKTSPTQTPKINPEADTDSDGMPDGWEAENKLNLKDSSDAKLDPDLDKLTNLEEYKYKTNPHDPDTDKDGYKDGDEVRNGFNPAGTGKLQNGTQTETKNFPTMRGIWQGQMTGGVYQIKDLKLIMQADGNISGGFTTQYGKSNIQNEVKGIYDFKKESGVFSANLSGTGTVLGKIEKGTIAKAEIILNLDGMETNKEITGTWSILPKTQNVSWLKNDRGSFKIKKTSGF